MPGVVAREGSLSNVEVVVCDLDGVVYRGAEPVTGAGGALRAVAASGRRIIFATNNSTRTGADVARAIVQRVGFDADADQVVTSALATAAWIARSSPTVFVVGEAGLAATLSASGCRVVAGSDNADAVVVGLDRSFDYATLDAASRAVRRGAALYATNTDATFPAKGGLQPGGGSMVAAIETASGRKAVVCGKPHEPMRRIIRELAGEATVAVVGDRAETDVAMGTAEGWATVLVLSGVTADPADVPVELTPTAVVESVRDVPRLLGIGDPRGDGQNR